MVKALLQTATDFQNYMKQYRENNKERINELNQQSYNCPYCQVCISITKNNMKKLNIV